jgi:bromodomain adjacent to zinc finger domain protein 1A
MDLQAIRERAYSKSRKKRSEAAAAVTNGATHASSNDDGKFVTLDARRFEATLKYPMEDLNVPSYRRAPSGLGNIIDMTPGTEGAGTDALNPTGDMPTRPKPNYHSTVPADCFGSFLMVWSFLGVFSQPLKLTPFSLDDFENALRHNSHSTIMIESNIALLNAIIKQRDRLKKESLGHGSTAAAASISLFGSGYQASRTITTPIQHPFSREPSSQYNSDDENEDEDHVWKSRSSVQRRVAVERGCGSAEVEAIGFNWDNGTVDTEDERIGWEDILIGFINQVNMKLYSISLKLGKLIVHF